MPSPSFTSPVVSGQARGRLLGYPTLNLVIPDGLDKEHGIYAAWVWIEGRRYAGAVHFGPIPTFQEEVPTLEIFVLDYSAPAPVKEVGFELISYLREIASFPTEEALIEQIAKDVSRTREVLADQELYDFIDDLPHPITYFEDGRIDFTHSPRTAALGVFVIWKGEVLLLKRSRTVGSYPGAWHIATGYLDERSPIREKAEIELWEEAGISSDMISSFLVIPIPTLARDPQGRDLLLFNCVAVLGSKPTITLNWEHTDWAWVEPVDLCGHAEVPGIEDALQEILPYIPAS